MINVVNFLKESRIELLKVTWPTRKTTVQLTQVVLIVSLIIGIYLGLLDFIFNLLLTAVLR